MRLGFVLVFVSIPFERESLSKGEKMKKLLRKFKKFQFPSSGKVYPKGEKMKSLKGFLTVLVSIPFERESLSKGAILSKGLPAKVNGHRKFQFPSSGKVYPK